MPSTCANMCNDIQLPQPMDDSNSGLFMLSPDNDPAAEYNIEYVTSAEITSGPTTKTKVSPTT